MENQQTRMSDSGLRHIGSLPTPDHVAPREEHWNDRSAPAYWELHSYTQKSIGFSGIDWKVFV